MNKVMNSAMSKGVPHEAASAIGNMFAYDENQYKDHWAHKVKTGDMLKLRGERNIKNRDGWVKVESITPTCVTINNGYSPAFIGTAYFYPPDEAGKPPFTFNDLIPKKKKQEKARNHHNYIAMAILIFIFVAVLITR